MRVFDTKIIILCVACFVLCACQPKPSTALVDENIIVTNSAQYEIAKSYSLRTVLRGDWGWGNGRVYVYRDSATPAWVLVLVNEAPFAKKMKKDAPGSGIWENLKISQSRYVDMSDMLTETGLTPVGKNPEKEDLAKGYFDILAATKVVQKYRCVHVVLLSPVGEKQDVSVRKEIAYFKKIFQEKNKI